MLSIKLARTIFFIGPSASVIALTGISPCAAATRQIFDMPAAPLGDELRAIGRASGRELMFSAALVAGKTGRPLKGNFTADEAVDALLVGSGLVADHQTEIILIHEAPGLDSTLPAPQKSDDDITVTGSRIRGAPIASSTIVLDRERLRDEGYTTLADAIRTVPQNFSGGQTPGVGFNTPVSSGENVGGASSIDLRGIGQDATLTLIDGRRVAYGGYRQSIDVSAIPLLALDRIEIVPDGASAIYGSDAVAGVANIILRKDYNGLTASARVGGSTDGGNFQQQYDVITGRRWSTGGFLVAYDFERDTPVEARQRDYAATINAGLTLYPALKHHDVLVNLHQDLSSNLTFSLYSFFNHRSMDQSYSIDGLASSPIYPISDTVTTFAISPELTFRLGGGWQVALDGTYGLDRVKNVTSQMFEGIRTPLQIDCFCNQAHSVEISADGPLFALPAGDVKVATGGGYRDNQLNYDTKLGGPSVGKVSQAAYYGYGEISIPLLSPDQQSPLGYRLNVTGAVRYETYPGIAKVATPKFGIIYAPQADVDLKASWGRSFKAPTLYQLYNTQYADAYDATSFGGQSAPNASAIDLVGGNPDLKPERAESWSATIDAHPQRIPGLKAEISYFHIRYRDRIVQPISSFTDLLDGNRFPSLIESDPGATDAEAAVTNRTFYDFTSSGFDPANVAAIIDDRYQNVASQTIRGVDASIEYRLETESSGTFDLTADTAYIRSTEQVTAQQASEVLAGTVFNPPHWRGRAGLLWQRDGVSISSYANYTGMLRDARGPTIYHIGAKTSVDLAGRYQLQKGSGILRGADLLFSVQNMFNVKPGMVHTDAPYEAGFDSTNYAAFGRVISLTLSKSL